MVDDVVGQVMTALERNELTDNTIVIFTSDNGCSPMADFEELASFGHDPSYVFRGHKADIFRRRTSGSFSGAMARKNKGGEANLIKRFA
ncbi:MAG: sulfatase-like hydrolase/transferase [Bacteroidia bacterium]